MTRQPILLAFGALLLVRFAAAQTITRPEVSIHATIVANGFYNSGRTNNSDVPAFSLTSIPGEPSSSIGGAIRQTRFRIEIRADSVLGGELFGELDTDFFGGQQPSTGGRTHPLLRVRRAYAEIRWPSVSVLVGQEAPPLFGVNPVSVASTGTPLFGAAGNLWLWLPQIRATGWLTPNARVRVGLEGTVLAPNAGEAQSAFATEPDASEIAGRPSLEARLVGRWTAAGREGEIGAGVHQGWLRNGLGERVDSRAVGASAIVPLGSFVEVRGEVFAGEALAGLGGGGVAQNLSGGQPVSTRGGWGQLVLLPASTVELGVGFGFDDPDDDDLGVASARANNQVVAASVTWRPAPVLVGLEVRRIGTRYLTLEDRAMNTHINLAVGIEF